MRVLYGAALLFGALFFLLRVSVASPFDFPLFSMAYGAAGLLLIFLPSRLKLVHGRRTTLVLLLSALVFRILLYAPQPLLSTDSYRYRWDGELVLRGINPTAQSPIEAKEKFPTLRDLPLPLDHADIPSVYPPLAQLVFAAVAAMTPGTAGFPLLAILLDLLSIFLLISALRRRGESPAYVLWFAWHPLAVLESGHNGHIESLGVALLAAALYFRIARPRATPFALAAAGLVKIWPVTLLTLCFSKARVRNSLFALLLFLIPTLFLFGLDGSTHGISRYLQDWEFHGSVFPLVRHLVSPEVARRLCFFGFLTLLAWFTRRRATGQISFEQAGLAVVGAFLLFSPTVHPWYALWLVPFLVFTRRFSWMVLSLTVAASYAVLPRYLADGTWNESLTARLATYLPWLVIWIIERVARRSRNSRATGCRKRRESSF